MYPDPKRIKVRLATPDAEVPRIMENYRVEPQRAYQEVVNMEGKPLWVYTQAKGHEWFCGAKKANVVNANGKVATCTCNFRNSGGNARCGG